MLSRHLAANELVAYFVAINIVKKSQCEGPPVSAVSDACAVQPFIRQIICRYIESTLLKSLL